MPRRQKKPSSPVYDVTVERNLVATMRDGTKLAADVYRPKARGRFPAVIERTPYNKEDSSETKLGAGEFFASRGYLAVFQDVRGRYASEGEWYPFRDDGWGKNRDGYDTVEWTTGLPWCSGKVGMIGGSYSGATQYLLAPSRPPHLTCMFARESSSDYHREWAYRGGAFELGFNLWWALRHTADDGERLATTPEKRRTLRALEQAVEELEQWYEHLPLKPMPPLEGLQEWYDDWLAHPADGPYWWQWNVAHQHQLVDVPIYHLGAWFDIFLRGTLENFMGILEHAESAKVRAAQKMTIGPWVHGPDFADERVVGEVDFGPQAPLGFFEARMPWFDYWLKGVETGIMDAAPVRLFVMGRDRWRDVDGWPVPGTRYVKWHMRDGTSGSARSVNDGRLTETPPGMDEDPDSYLYDPRDPVRGIGGNTLGLAGGPYDQRPVEERSLTYTSEPMERDLEVTGPVRCVIHGLSSAKDTDWVVRLCDVSPDGFSRPVCDGILRARYRNSLRHPEPLDGRVTRCEVDLWATSNMFAKGHRIRVAVTSSCFPRWDRNMNTGGDNAAESEGVAAVNTVFHDAFRPSHIVLPVVG